MAIRKRLLVHFPLRRRSRRLGAAAVELAVCLPVMVIIVFGAIEASNAIYLKQEITSAAYEAARTVTASGGTQELGESRFHEVSKARHIDNATIAISPRVDALTPRGTLVTVAVSARANTNSYGPSLYDNVPALTSTVKMVRQ
ncbi:MAG: pilus assembly protein [Planctomycetaceae bacterium]|nr:pilus assembly protein [Planctomycetales bacterium]MCB9921434.1 pilus assembly protein [Planctomycetaceae bacterium]